MIQIGPQSSLIGFVPDDAHWPLYPYGYVDTNCVIFALADVLELYVSYG